MTSWLSKITFLQPGRAVRPPAALAGSEPERQAL